MVFAPAFAVCELALSFTHVDFSRRRLKTTTPILLSQYNKTQPLAGSTIAIPIDLYHRLSADLES